MRPIQDGDYVFGEDFNVPNEGVQNYRVLDGCIPSTVSGMVTDLDEGTVLFDTRPYSIAADNITHPANTTLDRRYDVIVAREPTVVGPATFVLVQGTVNKKAPPISSGDIVIAIIQIDNSSTALDALHDMRYIVDQLFTCKLPDVLDDDVLFYDDFIGDDILPWWTFAGLGSYAMQDAHGGAVRITTNGVTNDEPRIYQVTKSFDLSKRIVYKIRARLLDTDYNSYFGLRNIVGEEFYVRVDFDGNAYLFVNSSGGSVYKAVSFAPGTNWFTVLVWNDPDTNRWLFRFDDNPTDGLIRTPNPTGAAFLRNELNQRGAVIQRMDLDYVKVWQPRD